MLPCYTLQPTQHHSFLRNEPPSLMNLVSVLQHLIKSAQCVVAGFMKKLMVRKGRNWRNCSYLISLSFSSTDSQGLRSSLNSRSSTNKTKITSENTMKFLRIIASESKMFRFYVLLARLPLTHQRGIEMENDYYLKLFAQTATELLPIKTKARKASSSSLRFHTTPFSTHAKFVLLTKSNSTFQLTTSCDWWYVLISSLIYFITDLLQVSSH